MMFSQLHDGEYQRPLKDKGAAHGESATAFGTTDIPSLVSQIMRAGTPLGKSDWRKVMLDLQEKQGALHDYMEHHVKREIRFAGVSRILVVDLGRRESGVFNLRWRIRQGNALNKFVTFDVVKSEVFPLLTVQDARSVEEMQSFMNELNVLDSILCHQIQTIQRRILSAHKKSNVHEG